MTKASNQNQNMTVGARVYFVVSTACFLAVMASGCAVTQKKATVPWKTAVLVRPNPPQQLASSFDLDEAMPTLDLEIPTPLAIARTVPARPRVFAPAPNSAGGLEKQETPLIVPDLSPQQSSSFQRETELSLAAAERNLAAVTGKSLNATQNDLVSKIRGFVADAREAGRAGDWNRARDLARKAQVLSDELAASL